MTQHLWTNPIYYVSEQLEVTEQQEASESRALTKKRISQLYICVDESESARPIVLGAGSYAVVVLASFSANPVESSEFTALKLLRMDKESEIYSRIGQLRFYSEVSKTRLFRSNHPFLVGYHGFGKTKTTQETVKKRDAEYNIQEVYGEQVARVVELNEKCGVHKFLEDGLSLTLMGEFYVMTAESGTIGDFLLQEYRWSKNPYYEHSPVHHKDFSELLDSELGKIDAANEMLDDLNVKLDPNDKSGLGVLRAVDRSSREFANRAIMHLFTDMVETVTRLHYRKRGASSPRFGAGDDASIDTGWAHRDIKPSNFLMEFTAPDLKYKVKATDLGFVIGANEAGNKETLSGTKDPGVLALGSYLYRAPEQRESRYEILFELPSEGRTKRITFVNTGDMEIHPGDLFESDNVFRDGDTAPDPGAPIRTTVTAAKNMGGKWEVELLDGIEAKAEQILYSADIVKLAGQHSDLFSLGATLYLLATGGKNPEKFYIKYLEDVPMSSTSEETGTIERNKSQFASISDSCFKIAMSLCLQEWQHKEGESRRVYDELLTPDDKAFIASYTSDGKRVSAAKRSKFGFGNSGDVKPEPDRELARYLTALQENPMLRYYLSNRNGNPIPFCLLFEIVRLMVRDREHSYVRNIDDSSQEGEYGYFAIDLKDRAGSCLHSCNKAMSKSADLKFDAGAYARVGDNAAEMVFLLRILFDELMGARGVEERDKLLEATVAEKAKDENRSSTTGTLPDLERRLEKAKKVAQKEA